MTDFTQEDAFELFGCGRSALRAAVIRRDMRFRPAVFAEITARRERIAEHARSGLYDVIRKGVAEYVARKGVAEYQKNKADEPESS